MVAGFGVRIFQGLGNGSGVKKPGSGEGIRPQIPGKRLDPAARLGSRIPLESGSGEKERNPPGIGVLDTFGVSKENYRGNCREFRLATGREWEEKAEGGGGKNSRGFAGTSGG